MPSTFSQVGVASGLARAVLARRPEPSVKSGLARALPDGLRSQMVSCNLAESLHGLVVQPG